MLSTTLQTFPASPEAGPGGLVEEWRAGLEVAEGRGPAPPLHGCNTGGCKEDSVQQLEEKVFCFKHCICY